MGEDARDTPSRSAVRRALRPGSRLGFGLAALLVVWAVMVLAWPVAVTGSDGQLVACGSAAGAAASAGTACLTATGQLRLQSLALFAAAVVVGVTALAVFGSEAVPVVTEDAPTG